MPSEKCLKYWALDWCQIKHCLDREAMPSSSGALISKSLQHLLAVK